MSTLDRYIIKSLSVNYLISLAVLMSTYVALDLFFNFDEFMQEDGIPFIDVVHAMGAYYGTHLFLYFGQIAGVIALFAMAVTLARLQRDNEFVAIVASGVSLYRVALTVILTGVALNALWLIDQEMIIPRLAPRLAASHESAALNRPYGVWFLRDQHDWLISARTFNQAEGQLGGVILLRADASGGTPELITADRALWVSDAPTPHWSLERGSRWVRNLGSGGDDRLKRLPQDTFETSMNPQSIALRQSTNWIQFLGRKQLTHIRNEGMAAANDVSRAIHNRFTTPIVNMFILIIGIPLFLDRQPASVLRSGGRCLVTCGVCFLFTFFCQNMVALDYPALTAWLPLIVLTPVMVVQLDRMKT